MNISPSPLLQSTPSTWLNQRASYAPTPLVAVGPTTLPTTSQSRGGARTPSKHLLLSPAELRASVSPIAWVVKGIFPERGLGLIYGASGAGKSFLALDLVSAVAEGRPWFGYKTKCAPIVYLCLEGSAGFLRRIDAWEAAQGRPFPETLRLMVQQFNLLEAEKVQELLKAILNWIKTLPSGIGPPVIVIDTLNRAIPGGDENGSSAMSVLLEACTLLSDMTGGLVLLVHHVGKDADRGPRGHNSLLAAADASLLVCRSGTRRFWQSKKVKDGEDGAIRDFDLEQVVLGIDSDGEEVTSCVVRLGACMGQSDPAPSDLSPSSKAALVTLQQVCGAEQPDGGLMQTKVPYEDWRAAFYAACSAASQSGKRNALHRATKELRQAGYIELGEDGKTVMVLRHVDGAEAPDQSAKG